MIASGSAARARRNCPGRLCSLFRPDNKIHFMRLRRMHASVLGALSILSVLLFIFVGLNFGIDFKGGTLIEVRAKHGAADLGAMRARRSGLSLGDVEVQEFGEPQRRADPRRRRSRAATAEQTAVDKCAASSGTTTNSAASRSSARAFRANSPCRARSACSSRFGSC